MPGTTLPSIPRYIQAPDTKEDRKNPSLPLAWNGFTDEGALLV